MRAALKLTDSTEAQTERRVRNKIEALRQDLARELVFGRVLAAMQLRRDRQTLMTSMFSRRSSKLGCFVFFF